MGIGATPQGEVVDNRTCSAIKRDGERCKATALKGTTLCFAHTPSNVQALRRNGAKGGRAAGRGRARSGTQELRELRTRLANLADSVEAGETSSAVAHAIAALGNVQIRSIEVERKVAEVEQYEERVAALEAVVRESGRRGAALGR
jgi:hypothetical protein